MLTIEDIRNPKRKSGFDHVGVSHGGNYRPNPYYANEGKGRGHGRNAAWTGPRRTTPEEAAQDYCEFVNGNSGSLHTPLKSAGHKGPQRSERTEKERKLRKQLREIEAKRNRGRKGYVYLIGEENSTLAVKIGHSYDPETRPNGLQTGNPRKLVVLGSMEGSLEDESRLHQRYINYNVLQEWFRPSTALLAEFGVTWSEYVRACGAGIVRSAA